MLFSVAIPVFNGEKTVLKTIQSVLDQSYNDEYEIIIVDNASKDNTLDVIKNNFSDIKIKLYKEKTTVNMWANHNRCLKYACGDYILFCHADDILLENALSDLERRIKFRNYRRKYVLWGHSFFRDYKSKLINTNWNINELIVGEKAYVPFVYGGLTPSGTCYSRESLLDVGGFVELKNRLAPSDYFTMIYLALNEFVFEMTDNIFFKRIYASTMTKNVNKKEVLESWKEGSDWIIKNVSEHKLKKIIIDPLLIEPAIVFLYGLSFYKNFKKLIRKRLLKYYLKNPFLIKNRVLMKTFINTLNRK